ncbi:hypothetical protein KC866_02990 [Patescibacteria group bacterium]|nr:hypothetical protein [Patescibacteria group bacterium]
MKKLILLIIGIGLVVLFVSYSKKDTPESLESTTVGQSTEDIEVKEVTNDEPIDKESVLDNYYLGGLDAGFVSMVLAKYSPTLTEEEKRTIEQDFYGAPNDMPASRYFVIADEVICDRVPNSDSIVDCTVMYPKNETKFMMSSEDSARLFVILDDVISVRIERAVHIQQINCSVDDYVVQTSPGDHIEGFDCDFTFRE